MCPDLHRRNMCFSTLSGLIVSQVTSCGGKTINLSKIKPGHRDFYLPIYPNPSQPPFTDGLLRLKNGATMRKHSYVNTLQVYRVSLLLLKEYDRDKTISTYCLESRSLEVVRAECVLRSRSRYQPPAATDALVNLPQPISHPLYNYQELRVQTQFQGVCQLPRSPATEQQPLLPPPMIIRSPVCQVEESSLGRSRWERESRIEEGRRGYSRDESCSARARLDIQNALFVCISLCMTIILFGLVGYGLFSGAVLLIHGLLSAKAAIQVGIAAMFHRVATFGRIIASSFVGVGRGIAAFGGTVAHFIQVIVHWLQRLRTHA